METAESNSKIEIKGVGIRKTYRMGEVDVPVLKGIDLKKAPISEVEQLSRVPGVSDLRHRISYPVIVDLRGADQPLSGKLLSLPDQPEPVINNIIIRSGSYFTGERENEVIVSESFARPGWSPSRLV